MTKIKFFYDKDAETKWIQKMSESGYAFKSFCLGVYTFEKCEPLEYQYQIDMLDEKYGTYEDYCEFMNENGIEIVQRWNSWIYLRKLTSEGPFELYIDNESKIALYERIKKMFRIFCSIEICCGLMELTSAIRTNEVFPLIVFIAALIIAIAMLRIIWKCNWKIEQLKDNN